MLQCNSPLTQRFLVAEMFFRRQTKDVGFFCRVAHYHGNQQSGIPLPTALISESREAFLLSVHIPSHSAVGAVQTILKEELKGN